MPAEGVVLIGVDLELQRRMAERIGLPARPGSTEAGVNAVNIGAPDFKFKQGGPKKMVHQTLVHQSVAPLWTLLISQYRFTPRSIDTRFPATSIGSVHLILPL